MPSGVHEDKAKISPVAHFPDGREILNALPFYAFLVDSRHHIKAVNSAVRRDLGLDPEQPVDVYCPAIIHGCENPVARCPLSEALRSGQAAEQEVFDSKSETWLSAAVYPLHTLTDDGERVYLHFARNITEQKKTERELSQTLEHQWAMSSLLRKLQRCHESREIIQVLIDQVLCLSWIGMSVKAVGFLKAEHDLQMVVSRNVDPLIMERCGTLAIGECCCGRVAHTGRTLICSDTGIGHTKCDGSYGHEHIVLPIRYEGNLLGVYTLYLYNLDKLDTSRLRFLESAADAAAVALATEQARQKTGRIQKKYVAQLISSQEDERKNVAQELQEHVCQSLSALLLETQVRSSEDRTINCIRELYEAQIKELIDEVRMIAGKLRPTILDDYGFESALSRLVSELTEHTPLEIDYQFVTSPEWSGRRLPAPVEIGLYRVAVDALNNVISHASATRLCVIVMLQRSRLMLLIEDNGCGFDYASVRKNIDRSMGLVAMEERIASLGGALKVESRLNEGTTVRVEMQIALESSPAAQDTPEHP